MTISPAIFHVENALEIVVRTGLVYVALLAGLRLAGKRELGQMTVFDLVVILVISNAVQNAMVGSDSSVTGGLLAAGTLLVLNFGLNQLRSRSRAVSRWIGGTPTLLVEDGKFVAVGMHKEGLTEDEVLMSMREHGVDQLKAVKCAYLETDGSISVVPADHVHARPRRHVRFLKKGG